MQQIHGHSPQLNAGSARIYLLQLLCLGLAAMIATPLAAQSPAEQLEAFLSAGEFGPARQLADRAATPAERDLLLSRLAGAQAAAGASRASIDSLRNIRDSDVRGQAIQDMFSGRGRGGRGGAAMADFDSLIELITTTIKPDSWEDVGGAGTIQEFRSGVLVDTDGLLQRIDFSRASGLADIRSSAVADLAAPADSVGSLRASSQLRKVSLSRLEREVQLRAAQGLPPDAAMLRLAGIYRIKYLLVYPESGEVVIAGPAGDWRTNAEGRAVNMQTGAPLLHLDDLVVVLRHATTSKVKLGCSIDPRKDNLSRTREYTARFANKSITPAQRPAWLEGLRASVGRQDVRIFGIPPNTRTARVLVEADYRMKLIGMGLEEPVPGVESYLDSIDPAEGIPNMSLLRWWFTLNYDVIRATPDRNAFALEGPGVQVMSENQLLTQQGKRLPTGKSDEITARFANSFTQQFELLAAKYPIYAELRNIFDLALVAALIEQEDLLSRTGWSASHLLEPQRYQLAVDHPPTEVESVINHRIIGGRQVVAGVSGGVSVDTSALVRRDAINTDDYGLLKANFANANPDKQSRKRWWWD